MTLLVRWTRRLLIAVCAIVVLIGAAAVLLLTIDLGRFKGSLEDYVSQTTQRDFSIAGRFEPSIGRTIDLIAEDVRLANADWGTAANMLELQRVVISIDTWSLLSGPIEVLNLEVEGLALHVEKDPESLRSSWSFGEAAQASDETDEPFELRLWLQQARLQQVDITYGQGWLDAPRNIRIENADLSTDESDLLRMALSGVAGGDEIQADGLIGPLAALINGKGPQWELNATIGNFLLSTEGTFRDLFSLEGPVIHAAMQGPFAERVLGRFGLPPIAQGPVDLTADIAEKGDGVDVHVEGAFGDLTAEVTGRMVSLSEPGDLNMQASVRGPNLQAIGEFFDAGFLPSTEFSVAGGVLATGDTLQLQSIVVSAGDARLEIDGILAPAEVDPDARVMLSASGPAIRNFMPPWLADRVPATAFDIRGIATGGLQQPVLQELTALLGGHELTVAGRLPTSRTMAGLDIDVTAKGPDIDQVAGPWVSRDLATIPYSLDTKLSNAGDGFVVENLSFETAIAGFELTGSSGTLPALEGMDASISLSGPDLQALMEPWLEVAVPAVPFRLDGRILESEGALQLSNVTYRVDDTQGRIDGTTGLLPSLEGLLVTTSLSGPDAKRFAESFSNLGDSTILPAAGFEMGGSFSKTGENWFISPWTLQIGDSKIELNGGLGDFTGPAGIDIQIAASGPDLRHLLPDRGIDVPVPYSVTGGMQFAETRIALKEVDLRIGETRVWLDGTLPATAEMTDVEFDFRVAGPNLGRFARAFDIQILPDDTFQFEGALKRSGDSYAVDDLVAVVGESDLGGSLQLETGPRLRLTGRLESSHLDLAGLRAKDDDPSEPDEDASKSDRLIPDTPLPLQVLDLADVDVTLHLQDLVSGFSEVGDVELSVVAGDDKLHVDTVKVALSGGGTMSATLDIDRTGEEEADVHFSAIAEQFNLRPPFDGDGNPIERPLQDLKLQLSGSGKTARELAASTNGSLSLRLGQGDIDNTFEGHIMRDMVSQVFTAINPLAKEQKYTRLNCAFFEIDIVDGIANERAVGFQTNRLAVASVGTLDLATEVIDFSFRVKQREGVGISVAGVVNPYIRVGGTMASPALQLDAKRGFLSGTVALLTGGLSILAQGVWDRYLSQDNYCQAVVEALESGEIPTWDGTTGNQ